MLRRLASLGVDLIVMEATGRWHRAAHRRLHDAGHPVAIVNPYRSRKFADAFGQLAKTDAIDARLLALFAARLAPPASRPASKVLDGLRDLVAARRSTQRELTALGNRLGAAEQCLVVHQLRARRRLLIRHVAALEAAIHGLIASDTELARRFAIVTSIPGIGPVTATTLIADMPELGACSDKQIAALAGVAPMNWDRGLKRGQRHIKAGRAPVRATLYMAAIAAIRANHQLKAFYKRLIDAGKKPKLALTAVTRKLLILANALLNQNRPWQPSAP